MKNKKSTLLYPILSFIFMIFIIVIRYPDLLLQPRFWAEEAFYFETFYRLEHWWQSFNVLIYPAYYLFLSRLAPSIATLFPLEQAAFVTSLFGLAVLSMPLVIIFFTDSYYWRSIKSKLLISVLYIVCSTTGEVWLTSTNIGFIVPVFMFLILIDDSLESLRKRLFYYLLVFIGAISGPIAMIMAPFFFAKYFVSKNQIFGHYCIALSLAAILQMSYFLTANYFGVIAENRLDLTSWDWTTSLSNTLAYNFIFPLFGYFSSLAFREFFSSLALGLETNNILSVLNISSENAPALLINALEALSVIALPFLCILSLIITFVLYKVFKLAALDKRIYFIGLYIYLVFMLHTLSLGAEGGFRYSLITSFILLFYLHTILIDFPHKRNYLVKSLLSISLFIGIAEYYPRIHVYTPNTFVAQKIEWPIWSNEIKLWKSDSSYLPKAWPYLKNKDLIYPDRKKNEANIVCIDLNNPNNWEHMGSRRFTSSFSQMLISGINEGSYRKIIHYDNCGGNIIVNGEQESSKQ